MSEFNIDKIVRDFLKFDVATHKRRCAVRAGVRESYELESDCDHSDFDNFWCNHCGITLEEIIYKR